MIHRNYIKNELKQPRPEQSQLNIYIIFVIALFISFYIVQFPYHSCSSVLDKILTPNLVSIKACPKVFEQVFNLSLTAVSSLKLAIENLQ